MAPAPSPHVKLTASLFVVWGVLTTLIGLSTLVLGLGAAALAGSDARQDAGGQLAAGLAALTFVVLAVVATAWGAAHIVVGTRLRRRVPWSRLAAIMLSTFDLFLLPYGTALGCYSLWTLLSESGKSAFLDAGATTDRRTGSPAAAADASRQAP